MEILLARGRNFNNCECLGPKCKAAQGTKLLHAIIAS